MLSEIIATVLLAMTIDEVERWVKFYTALGVLSSMIGGVIIWLLCVKFVTRKEFNEQIGRLRDEMMRNQPDPVTEAARREKFDLLLEQFINELRIKRRERDRR